MKLGIISNPSLSSFENAKSKALSFVEFCINVDRNVDEFLSEISEIKNHISKTKVEVLSMGRWGADKINSKGIINSELENDKKLIKATGELGCPVYNTGCNYVDNLSFFDNCKLAIEYFQTLVDFGKQYNVKIATYNCRWNNFVHSDPVWTIIHGHIKDLGIKFDPSHSIYDNGDYLSEMKKWGKRFYHVHIKGSLVINQERYDDPPAGLDQTDWGSFMAVLYAVGYDKTLSIEPHSQTWTGDLGEKGIDFTINYMNKFLFK